MRVQAALLARYAEVETHSGMLNITGGGVDVFGLEHVPVEFPVGFALSITFEDGEANLEHRLGLTVLGPDLQPVGNAIDVAFTPKFGSLHEPGWLGHYAVTGSLDLLVTALGAHSVQIIIDGRVEANIPFRAVAS